MQDLDNSQGSSNLRSRILNQYHSQYNQQERGTNFNSIFIDLDEADFTGDSQDISPESVSQEDEDSFDEHERAQLSTTAADIDLGTSLSTLISGKDPKDTRQQRKLSRKRISSRIPLNGVRIISDEELDRRNCKMKKNTRSGPSKEAQRDATSSNGSSAIPNKPIDVQTITLAAAGISLVAGLSFSAGYAIGRRSSGLLRVSG